jgi:hypothetical protein
MAFIVASWSLGWTTPSVLLMPLVGPAVGTVPVVAERVQAASSSPKQTRLVIAARCTRGWSRIDISPSYRVIRRGHTATGQRRT